MLVLFVIAEDTSTKDYNPNTNPLTTYNLTKQLARLLRLLNADCAQLHHKRLHEAIEVQLVSK